VPAPSPPAATSASHDEAMPNDEMVEYWTTRGGERWVAERDRFDRMLEPCGRRLLESAALARGEQVLDVGCGNGATSVDAARRVAPGGSVVGVDLSTAMLETARERAATAEVDASFVAGDAQVADLGGPYDVAISRFGVMFFDDPAAAFANVARAMRPGGRLTFVCWQDLLSNEWIAVVAGAFVAHVGIPDLPEAGAPGPFSLADPARTRQLLEGAGFRDVAVDPAADQLVLGDTANEVVEHMAADEMGRRMLYGKDPDDVEAALAAARDALVPHETADGVVLGGAYWLVTATRA
jgi:SAM-dependent methyltransferase